MSSNTPTTSSHQRTTTEENSMTPSHNVRMGFPFACSCCREVHMATVQDQIFNERLCYVCEYTGEGGDHLEKMFDEVVVEEVEWMKRQVRDHEDRISRVETNIPFEQTVDLSREITKVLGMVKTLREDLEILDLRYCAVYGNCANTPRGWSNRFREAVSRFTHSGRLSCALSLTVGALAGYIGHRWGFQLFSGRIH